MANPSINLIKSGGNQASDTLSSSISNSDTAFPMNDNSEFDNNTFIGIVDEGTASEELVEFSGTSGANLTAVNRGILGTSAVGHDAGATVRAILTDWQWDALINHVKTYQDDDGVYTHNKWIQADNTSGSAVNIIKLQNTSNNMELGVGLDMGGNSIIDWDGWSKYLDASFEYNATDSIKTTTDVDITGDLQVGMKVKLDNTSTKYFYVAAFDYNSTVAGRTYIEVVEGEYTIVNSAITNVSFSFMNRPKGFPAFDYRCSLYLTGDIAISNATYTAIPFTGENYDPENMHSTNDTKITIKKSGVYLLGATVNFLTSDNIDILEALIRKNNTTYTHPYLLQTGHNTAGTKGSSLATMSGVLELSKDDYVELYVRQESGSSKNLKSSYTHFWIAEYRTY